MRKFAGLIAGLIAVIVLMIFRLRPVLAESLYGDFLFPIIRFLLDYSLGLLPFAVIYILPIALVALVWMKMSRTKGRVHRVRILVNTLGILLALFYLMWGFNYARPNLSERIGLGGGAISDSLLFQFAHQTAKTVNDLRTDQLFNEVPSDNILEPELRRAVAICLSDYGIELTTRCRVRPVSPPGVLRKLGITGIYMPYTGEALLEKSHPQPEKIFVMAHELAHSFGVTDEGEANLVAYLSCIAHENPVIQYAGHLAMWEYTRYTLRKRNISTEILSDSLSSYVKEDLELLRAERMRYKEWIPQLGEVINDTYLKAQGIEDGVYSYNSLPELYLQHRNE